MKCKQMDQERVQQRKIKALQQCKITCCAMAPVPNKPPAKTVYHTKLRTLPIQGCHVWLPGINITGAFKTAPLAVLLLIYLIFPMVFECPTDSFASVQYLREA